ncbi:ABC-type Fe3 transport system, periplasmic component [Clostridium aceticum]|uniref:ABC-type Fe3 transport system, periplasmic component n=1 Tax=Clostridium aceticum TaxID=84022 RepID=A0A0D8I7N8_9CLOT|nr:ABC transporter substrate-binding protein [Clostridium aceticum]AKL97278.1 ABC-type Fe3 transport system, periplasmic component [Clostridium aceticum]KJF26300.1 ABC transporter substrate-binding protein [Clostridium aceticum]
MSLKTKIMAGVLAGGLILLGTGCQKKVEVQNPSTEALNGVLTVYTSQPEADIQALVESFNTVYPDIKVDIFRSGTEEVVSKVLAEKEVNAVQADVLLVADAPTFEMLKSKDLLMSYASPELAGISDDFYDEENTYTGTKIISTGIIVNTDVVNDKVESFADLTKKELDDSLIMPSPLYSGAAAYNLGVLTRTEGVGWEFYESLKSNGIIVEKGNGAVQSAVVSGQKGAGIIIDYMALRAKADGAPVEFVYPKEGSLIITEPVAILKNTKNEELAKTFVDYILSVEGQKATAAIGYTPIKSGVAAPEGFKTADEIKNLTYELSILVENRDTDKEKFSQMFQ